MRSRLAVAGLVGALLAGCAPAAAKDPPPVPVVSDWPASVAGGACLLLDYAVIESVLGTRFDVSGANRQQATETCVVQIAGKSRPDLALTVTPLKADAAVFKDTVVPNGARTVTGLGRAGYRHTLAARSGAGPAAEVGWLSAAGKMITLRYTFAPGAARAEATALAPKLVELARKIDLLDR